MIKTNFLLSSIILLLLLSGCTPRELVLNDQNNVWGRETDIEENIDISDLYNEKINATESETAIKEDMFVEKMERVTFPIAEYNRLEGSGKGTVQGSIYVEYSSGKRVVGVGTRLYLNPVTSYSKQWYEQSYLGGHKMQKADDRLFNYLRFTAANAQGKFAFYGVPNGSYYLIGTVKCAQECGYTTPKNIRIATQVSVRGNQIVQRDLSRVIY